MQRKLIKLSTSTMVISIPRPWISQQELQKGDTVHVEEIDGSLIINPQKEQKKEITIDISKAKDNLIWYMVDGAYTAGYDKISIITKNNEQTKHLGKVIRYFPGMIIEEERKTRVEMRDLSSTQEVDADKLFRRIFHMIGSLFEDLIQLIKEKNWEELKDLKRRDYTINSYFSLFLRYIAKKGYSSFRKAGHTHAYLKILELFSDRLCELAYVISEEKKQNAKQIELLQDIYKAYKEVEKQHFTKNKNILALDTLRVATEEKIRKSTPHRYQFSDLIAMISELEQLEISQTM